MGWIQIIRNLVRVFHLSVSDDKSAVARRADFDLASRITRPRAYRPSRWILSRIQNEVMTCMTSLAGLKVKIFANGADRGGMLDLYRNPLIKGFTTNPTLMRNAGIADYEAFARDILKAIPDRPISLKSSPTNLRRWSHRLAGSHPGEKTFTLRSRLQTRRESHPFLWSVRLQKQG